MICQSVGLYGHKAIKSRSRKLSLKCAATFSDSVIQEADVLT